MPNPRSVLLSKKAQELSENKMISITFQRSFIKTKGLPSSVHGRLFTMSPVSRYPKRNYDAKLRLRSVAFEQRPRTRDLSAVIFLSPSRDNAEPETSEICLVKVNKL